MVLVLCKQVRICFMWKESVGTNSSRIFLPKKKPFETYLVNIFFSGSLPLLFQAGNVKTGLRFWKRTSNNCNFIQDSVRTWPCMEILITAGTWFTTTRTSSSQSDKRGAIYAILCCLLPPPNQKNGLWLFTRTAPLFYSSNDLNWLDFSNNNNFWFRMPLTISIYRCDGKQGKHGNGFFAMPMRSYLVRTVYCTEFILDKGQKKTCLMTQGYDFFMLQQTFPWGKIFPIMMKDNPNLPGWWIIGMGATLEKLFGRRKCPLLSAHWDCENLWRQMRLTYKTN